MRLLLSIVLLTLVGCSTKHIEDAVGELRAIERVVYIPNTEVSEGGHFLKRVPVRWTTYKHGRFQLDERFVELKFPVPRDRVKHFEGLCYTFLFDTKTHESTEPQEVPMDICEYETVQMTRNSWAILLSELNDLIHRQTKKTRKRIKKTLTEFFQGGKTGASPGH